MLMNIRRFLILPAEISPFERTYLGHINRMALVFFYAHLPLMMVVAWLCGTSVRSAAAFTALVLVGPTLAMCTFENPRWTARVVSFAAMGMGGVLVDVGQGPMQVEMHFYFFVLIALLAVYADPLVIMIAAATVALHHVAVYVVMPSGIFNYQASMWTVVVHALFVALESAAACFVARSFFDNVIGLERIVAQRTDALASRNDEMRGILDNLRAGLVTFDARGIMSSERSAALTEWLGRGVVGETFWAFLARSDAGAAMWVETSWDMVTEGILPVELALAQFPRRVRAGGRTLNLTTRVLGSASEQRILAIFVDVTSELRRERLETEQRELVTMCEHAVRDPSGFWEFMEESERLVRRIEREADRAELLRLVHTLKGNCAIFGAGTVARGCHELEALLAEHFEASTADRGELLARWTALASKVEVLRGSRTNVMDIRRAEHADVVSHVRAGVPRTQLIAELESWRCERASQRLERIADQAQGVALRLGREPLEICVEDAGLRLPDRDLSSFWGCFVHLVRNAVDHGIEPAEERVANGKSPAGRLALRVVLQPGAIAVELEDDGRGIDWVNVATRARDRNLPATTREDLVEALFSSGFTTRNEATEMSGRGVGMSAVRLECNRLGALLSVEDVRGGGTLVRVIIPDSAESERNEAAE